MSERYQNAGHRHPHPGGGQLFIGQTRFLFYSGWAIALLYLPSGLMHLAFGRGVYFRDGLLFLHLIGCIRWLAQRRELKGIAQRHWLLAVPIFFILPALFNGDVRVEALTFVKWGLLWLDWIILGYLATFARSFTTGLKILIGLTLLLLLADLGCGIYERATGAFVISGEAVDQTAFGVRVDMEHTLGDQLRVKGLQRDVFSFANLMGAGAVLGLVFLINCKRLPVRLPAMLWTLAFVVMLLMSGGRSAFFGVLAVGMMAAAVALVPEWSRRWYPRIALAWLIIFLLLSFVGIGRISEAVGASVFQGGNVGSASSAYERDNNWASILDTMGRVPIVLIFGGPLSSLLDARVDAIYHWADNEYFWLLYHTSIMGFVAVIWYFRLALTTRQDPGTEPTWPYDAVVLFLLFVMGEAIARESMTFIGVMPLFVAIGYHEATRAAARPAQASSTRPTASRRRQGTRPAASEASDFSRRIKARLKEKE